MEQAYEDEEEEQRRPAIDWSSLLAAADDPELADFLTTPVDNAVQVLKEGREIQKLSVIRTLGDLLDTEGEQAIEKVLPLIQKVLEEEASNLDIHCEAAVTYKNIFRNEKLTARFTGLSDIILSGILQNIGRQKDNLTAAAWLETLVEVLDAVPVSTVKYSVLPVALSQAEPTQRVQRRVIATKLLEKLCAILPPLDVRKELAPCAQMLSQDSNPNVRSSIAQRLGVIAQSLQNASDCGSLLLPCLIELCKDEDVGVREAILNTVAICLPHFTKENRKNAIIPLLKKSTEQAIFLKDETLSVVAKNFGEWIFNLKDAMADREKKWFLDSYLRIANLCQTTSMTSSTTSVSDTPNSVQTIARRMCAYNFPCVVLVYGNECFMERLLPVLEAFCSDPDDEVRSATAAGFHEIVNLVPNEPALIPPFIELIRGSAAEVVGHLTGNLDRILPVLYKCSSDSSTAPRISRAQLDRILIGCNRLIRGSGSWRAHHSYLQNIAVIRKLIPVKDLFLSFVPMLKQEALTARAIPCRIAAAITLLLFMRESPDKKERETVIDFFVHSIAKHRSCHRRRLFLDMIPLVMTHFSRSFFHQYLLDVALRMSTDSVSNIRLQLSGLLPKVKENLILPQDEVVLQKLEKTVREMLSKESNSFARQIIQSHACELSRAETKVKCDKNDEAKEKEEKQLWEAPRNEKATTDEEQRRRLSSSSDRKVPVKEAATSRRPPVGISNKPDTGPWKMRASRPKTAVVRPQPQVVVTQRSPSPMPRADERKSRLPLANNMNGTSTPGRYSSSRPSAVVPPRSATLEKSKLRAPSAVSSTATNKSMQNSYPSPTNNATPSTLRRSSTASTGFNSNAQPLRTSNGLVTSRSSSCLRKAPQGLIKVQSISNIEKRPIHMSMKIRAVE